MTTRISGAEAAGVSEKRVIGNVLRGSIGNLIEWYDWYAYAAFTTYFAKSFFPTTDTTAALRANARPGSASPRLRRPWIPTLSSEPTHDSDSSVLSSAVRVLPTVRRG